MNARILKSTAILASISVALLLLAGCIVQSIHPFYQEQDECYEEGLLGKWANQSESDSFWVFEQRSTNCYKLTIINGTNVFAFHAQLFKLKGQLFIDGVELSESPYLVAPHHLVMVNSLYPKLEVTPLSHEWLSDTLEKSPKTLKHTSYYRDSYYRYSDDNNVLLTAETPDLQKFIIKNMKNASAWPEKEKMIFARTGMGSKAN